MGMLRERKPGAGGTGHDLFDRGVSNAIDTSLARYGIARARDREVPGFVHQAVSVGDLTLFLVEFEAGEVIWPVDGENPLAGGDYYLLVQLSETCEMGLGVDMELHPGELALIDPGRMGACSFRNGGMHMGLRISRSKVDGMGLDWRRHVSRVVTHEGVNVIVNLASSALDASGPLPSGIQAALERSFLNIVTAIFYDNFFRNSGFGVYPQCPALRKILDYLSVNLHRGDLTPGNIARQFAMSERKLHRLFRSQGLTVCGWIREARLQRCAATLRDPLFAELSVTEVAFNNGFNDCAHFSRLFKELFQCSPAAYRRANIAHMREFHEVE